MLMAARIDLRLHDSSSWYADDGFRVFTAETLHLVASLAAEGSVGGAVLGAVSEFHVQWSKDGDGSAHYCDEVFGAGVD
jgi:hypothetical protein